MMRTFKWLTSEEGDMAGALTVCCRPYLVQRIPHTNLVLIVVKSMSKKCLKNVTSSPVEISDNGTDHACQKLHLSALPRRRLAGCFSENPLVSCEVYLLYSFCV